MRSVRYATASSFYHKKITLITALFFFLFSFLLTGLFNLIDFEKVAKKLEQIAQAF